MLHKQEEMGALGIWKQNYKDKMGGGGGGGQKRGKGRGEEPKWQFTESILTLATLPVQ